MTQCYECGRNCRYLFHDGRCYDCTRLTPEEVSGQDRKTYTDDQDRENYVVDEGIVEEDDEDE